MRSRGAIMQLWRPRAGFKLELRSEKTSSPSLSLSFPIMSQGQKARGAALPQKPHGISGPTVEVGEMDCGCA